jgi:undecaprenyl-diphosphatase
MSWFEAVVLGVVQGVTEFLPISSDGHLVVLQILFARMAGRALSGAENLFFNVMLHVGTLAAILIYFRTTAWKVVQGALGHPESSAYRRVSLARVLLLSIVATLPLVPLKLFAMKGIESTLESPTAAAFGFLTTAAVLLITARLRSGTRGLEQSSWLDALLVGLAQCLAPLPGVSRSGMTIAAGLALGFSPLWAVQFSLLIAVPAILGAAVSELRDLDRAAYTSLDWNKILVATAVAGIVGYGAIAWLVSLTKARKLWWFASYLVALAIIILIASGQAKADRIARYAASGEQARVRASAVPLRVWLDPFAQESNRSDIHNTSDWGEALGWTRSVLEAPSRVVCQVD